MKKKMYYATVFISVSLLILSCSTGSNTDGGKRKPQNIMGFSIGMDLDEAKENAVRLLSEAEITAKASDEKKIDINDSYQLMILDESGYASYMDLSADSDRRLTRFSFHPNTVDLLFGLKGQDNDAVANKVMADFDLPDLTQNDSGHWEYREVEGINIKLHIKVSNRYFTIEGFVFD